MKAKKPDRPSKTAKAGHARARSSRRSSARPIHEVDEKGLLFLLRQAQVLIHNARVESLNREAGRRWRARRGFRRGAAPRRAPAVSIEEPKDGKTIFLNIGEARKVLDAEEMRRLVRICYAAETRSEALRQLFTVLAKERKDILADAIIGSPDNPLLEALFNAVRATYRLKER